MTEDGAAGPAVLGMPRSGTTLVARLLASQPGLDILEQPLPLLYPLLKRDFLEARPALEDRCLEYPNNDAMGPNRYDPAEFRGYLDHIPLSHGLLDDVRARQETYRGTGDRSPLDANLISASADRPARDLLQRMLTGGGQARMGFKEVTAEEFLPWFLASGLPVVLIIRDPRDVYASQTRGRGESFAGRARPLLFVVRMWRKIAHLARCHRSTRGLALVRYEDLVTTLPDTLRSIADSTGLSLDPAATPSVDAIPGGSSWTDPGRGSIGRYRTELSRRSRTFIEALCREEMGWLGYAVSDRDPEEAIRDWHGEGPGRAELAYWDDRAPRSAEELARRRWLRGGSRPDLLDPWENELDPASWSEA